MQDLGTGEEENDDDFQDDIGCFDDGSSHWPEAWMSFRTEGGNESGTAYAGAHQRRSPERRLWVSLTITCTKQDPFVHWGIRVHLKVFNERYGAHNPGALDLFFPASASHSDSDWTAPLAGLTCELLAGAAAEQFATRFADHPAFRHAKTQPHLVLVEFDSRRAFLEAGNNSSFADLELLRMSKEKSHIGPGLADALTAFRRAAHMAGRVRIVAYMTPDQHSRLRMKTIPAMALGSKLIKLLEEEEDQ